LREKVSLYEKSRAAEFGFTLQEFCELLKEASGASIENLRVEDLVLARACARGCEIAWERFVTLYREKLYTAATAIAKEESIARELADSIYAELFGVRVGNNGRRVSKLESYTGRGSLEGWLRTVLAQAYVNRYRHNRKLVAFEESICAGANKGGEPDWDSSRLGHATDAALAGLAPDARFLLAAYYLDGRTLAEVGRLINVHESTVSRRIEKIITTLRKQIIARLRAMGVSKDAAEEMLASDVRNLEVDVRNHLAQEGEA
jgi:RNA polymerase sigma-70 factor (ECF subfamily)